MYFLEKDIKILVLWKTHTDDIDAIENLNNTIFTYNKILNNYNCLKSYILLKNLDDHIKTINKDIFFLKHIILCNNILFKYIKNNIDY